MCFVQMTGFASFKNGTLAEEAIAVNIRVVDLNDNAPVFPDLPLASVYENRPEGVSLAQCFSATMPGNTSVPWGIIWGAVENNKMTVHCQYGWQEGFIFSLAFKIGGAPWHFVLKKKVYLGSKTFENYCLAQTTKYVSKLSHKQQHRLWGWAWLALMEATECLGVGLLAAQGTND